MFCPADMSGVVGGQDEESRLLFDDPNGIHYGSFGEQQMTSQNDPMEAQREIEALQRVVARTSEYVGPGTRRQRSMRPPLKGSD